jgi:hypothetical protein
MANLGIACDISVIRPPNGDFSPGQTVAGDVRIKAKENVEFSKIVVTLKGIGRLSLTKIEVAAKSSETTFYNSEEYVNDETVEEFGEENLLRCGRYEKQFNFLLPADIPSTVFFSESRGLFKVYCSIIYYIHVQVEKLGVFNKIYNEEISVVAGITPRLPRDPIVYISNKKLFQLFTLNDKTIDIKGTIKKSVIDRNGILEVNYEITNTSNVSFKSIETKIIAVYTFYTARFWGVKIKVDEKGTAVKTGPIAFDNTYSSTVKIDLPQSLYSIENSKFVTRDYALVITAQLPLPYRNASLEIPIQIGNSGDDNDLGVEDTPTEAPPSYDESMRKCTRHTDEVNDTIYWNNDD